MYQNYTEELDVYKPKDANNNNNDDEFECKYFT